MKNCWILIGNISGDVSYGVDESYYIIGVYETEDQAVEAMEHFKNSTAVFEDVNGFKLYESYGGTISSTDDPIEDIKDPFKYKEFYYRIVPFIGKPIFCGGAAYLE